MSLERDLPLTYFNPCLREGGDLCKQRIRSSINNFNPRLREGGDHLATTYVRWLMYFNPRLREGGDIDAKAKVCPHCQFQSTPPRRRRPLFLMLYTSLK